jgi:hypothetical protein
MIKELNFIVIIANYNGEKYLTNCLNSLRNTNYKNFKICIVDDGSTDYSLEIIKDFMKLLNIDLIVESHGGASKARNVAIKKYCDTTDVIVFLDNDTEVDKSWLCEINKYLSINSEVSGVQCLLIDYEDRTKIQSNGIYLIPHVCWGVSIQAGVNIENLNTESVPCAAISAALAIKSEVIKDVGLFDEKLAVSTEDLDFVWRIWIYGYKIYNCPSSIVYHFSKSIENRKEMNVNLFSQYFHISKNSTRSLIKNYSFFYLIYYLPLSLIINFCRALLVLIKRNDSSSIKAFLNSLIWNFTELKDTLNNRRIIQGNRRNNDNYIYNVIMIKNSLPQIYEKNFKQTNLL